MPFPTKGPAMPPPGTPDKKPAVTIGIGVEPKKPGEGEEPKDGGKDMDKLARAGVIREDRRCQNCENWTPETGDCKELPGSYAAGDACLTFFEPMGDSQDPNEAGEGEEEGAMPPPEPVGAEA